MFLMFEWIVLMVIIVVIFVIKIDIKNRDVKIRVVLKMWFVIVCGMCFLNLLFIIRFKVY